MRTKLLIAKMGLVVLIGAGTACTDDGAVKQRFIAVGGYNGASVRGSDNGTAWEDPRLLDLPSGIFYGIASVPGRLVTVGQNSQGLAVCQYSSDGGANWLAGIVGVGVTGKWLLGIAAGEDPYQSPWVQYWVAVGHAGLVTWSTNGGLGWNQVDAGTTTNLRAIAYGNGVFVAVGDRQATGAEATVRVSANGGKIWFGATGGLPAQPLYGIGYGNGRFVAVGGDGTIVWSTNGSVWNTANSLTTSTLRAVAWANGRWIAVGWAGTIRFSTDNGVTWTHRQDASPTSQNLHAIAFRDGRFVAVGYKVALYTDDGLDWVLAREFAETKDTLWGVIAVP